MHPYRPFAAAWRRRRIATASPAPQRGYHGATTRLLRVNYDSYYEATTRLLRGYYVATTRLLRGHYQANTRLLRGYHEATTRSRTRATRPAAQQRQHRSSAGAAHASNSEPAPTIRTPMERSQGGHSPHAEQAGQLRRPSTPISSCSRMQLVCSPACTPTSPTKTSTSSELAWAKWNMMELFMTDRHQHLPAATMLHVLDSTPLRHSRTSQCGRAASSRRAAAAARRSARGPHAPRSGSRARDRRHERRERREPTHRRRAKHDLWCNVK